jgi:orotate phosphoribosyltransferase/AMMECR1 domain-containing protein
LSNRRAQLLSLLNAHGILRADENQPVVGRNGERAAWMLYAWPLTMRSETLAMMAQEMLRLVDPFEATQLAANGYGAVPLLSAMVLESGGRYQGMVVRPTRKQHGAVRRIDGAGDTSKRVVVVDDSISSGTSFREACKALEEHGYDVEGTVCLTEFSYRGGRERAEAQGYRVATMFDIWRDFDVVGPPRAPGYTCAMPESWSDHAVPPDLDPATAARRVAEHFILTGEVLRPPVSLETDQDGRGGVFVSIRRRSDDHRLGRNGFWHFDPTQADACRDVVLATALTLRRLARLPSLRELGARLKFAVTFFGPLEEVSPAQLDFSRYGIVVSSSVLPDKLGGALPNTQFFTSTYEQYRHARWTNAKVSEFEPHHVFRHELTKCVEAGYDWPPYGTNAGDTDGWLDAAELQVVVVDRLREVLEALKLGEEAPESVALQERLSGRPVVGVGVSLYDHGIAGCVVSFAKNLDDALVRATRGALSDRRFGTRDVATYTPMAIVISLLHSTERLGHATEDAVARKLRRGKDGLSVRDGERFAVYLDSVPVHYDWTKKHTVSQLLQKAGIKPENAAWSTHKVQSWMSIGDTIHTLDNGFSTHHAAHWLTTEDLVLMGEHLVRRLDLDHWPAYSIRPRQGTLHRSGTSARCLHALIALDAAGHRADRPEWVTLAAGGIDYALSRLSHDDMTLDIPSHTSGPVAEALLLTAVASTRHPALKSNAIESLARKIGSWARPDGSIRPPNVLASAADHDFLPGIALMALSTYAFETGVSLEIDWDRVCCWYRRRAELVHPWALMAWHAQAWHQVARLTGDYRYDEISIELATWMVERQLEGDGSFLTDMYDQGASFHTGFAAEGVAAGWRSAILLGDDDRAKIFELSWQRAMTFMNRLLVLREDTFWMPEPVLAAGGIRCALASSDMRVDYTSHTMMAVIGGLAATTWSRGIPVQVTQPLTGTSHQHQMVLARPGPAATTGWPLLSKQHSTHPRTDQAPILDVAGPVENNQPPN